MISKNDCKVDVKIAKDDLRFTAKNIRKSIFSLAKNKQIIQNIKNFEIYQNAKNIMFFYPLDYEVDLRELFVQNLSEKCCFLPKTVNDEIFICKYENESSLVKGNFGILEPSTKIEKDEKLDLIFVPALCVDKNKNRLGYGKGFYDRFLAKNNVVTIAAVFDELIFDEVMTNDFDKKIDYIISDKRII